MNVEDQRSVAEVHNIWIIQFPHIGEVVNWIQLRLVESLDFAEHRIVFGCPFGN
jgi:hypothetical protein